jgi:hypothetical protein
VTGVRPYQPLSIAALARAMTGENEAIRWRLVAEFLKGCKREPAGACRLMLLAAEPAGTGDEHWDVFLAALAEHVSARDGYAPPKWAFGRALGRAWFPFPGPAYRADAFVHAPASFRKRGIFIAPQDLEVV